MSRVKRGTNSNKRRKNVLAKAKGFRFGRSTKFIQAKEAVAHAGVNAFRDRKRKKREFRGLWNIKIGAGLLPFELAYSKFIDALKKNNIALNRKVLSEIAEEAPETFAKIVVQVKG
ncbi:MAG: 50S ribosomal protein L20 [Candidatus Pacebacteria bacterium]|nr:50S ribosomal protein L20 [Candidatus Paceibacterota bacterium]